METYKNDYTKEEDYMMWELHEIRNKLAEKKLNCDQINSAGEDVIKKYQLNKIKSLSMSEIDKK